MNEMRRARYVWRGPRLAPSGKLASVSCHFCVYRCLVAGLGFFFSLWKKQKIFAIYLSLSAAPFDGGRDGPTHLPSNTGYCLCLEEQKLTSRRLSLERPRKPSSPLAAFCNEWNAQGSLCLTWPYRLAPSGKLASVSCHFCVYRCLVAGLGFFFSLWKKQKVFAMYLSLSAE